MTAEVLLVELNKGVGVLVALIGSGVVAPGALRHLWLRRLVPWAIRVKKQLRGFFSRFIDRLRCHRHIYVSEEATISDELSSVTTSVSTTWHVGASELKIGQVRQRVEELVEMLKSVDSRTLQDRQVLENNLHDLRGKLSELEGEVEKDRQQDVEVNAKGLPLISAGILLSGIPDWLARIPYGIGWGFPVAALLLTAVITWPGLRRRVSKG